MVGQTFMPGLYIIAIVHFVISLFLLNHGSPILVTLYRTLYQILDTVSDVVPDLACVPRVKDP